MTDANAPKALTVDRLRDAVNDDAAIRFVARLQPAGGAGDKVFPPTYTGGQYAIESRVNEHGVVQDVVLLDSVQSQANRMEQALLAAHHAGRVKLPMIAVDFSKVEQLKEIGQITVLDAPHRLADAILRDSMLDKALFPTTVEGQVLRRATPRYATDLFRLCPTALLFGIWESTGAAGGLGVKFQRAIVSEIVGVGAVVGRKTASRIDPLQIGRIPVYEAREPEGGTIRWTADERRAVREEDQPKRYKLDAQGRVNVRAKGVPSEINHGNVTPDIARHRGQVVSLGRDVPEQQLRRDRDGRIVSDRGERILRDRDELPGGVTFKHAEHRAVISLAALRKLSFPLDGDAVASPEARCVLAALGLFALVELRRTDYDLRSRCALVLDGAPILEIVKRDGTTEAFSIDDTGAISLLEEAARKAAEKKLTWRTEPIILTPSVALQDLILQSRSIGSVEADAEDESDEQGPTQEVPAEE